MPSMAVGGLCTAPGNVAAFLDRIDGPPDEPLRLDRHSYVWDAVESAHRAGKRGAGRTVAILDSDFDIDDERLRNAWTPRPPHIESPRRGHGTAVALLIHEIAPEAVLRPIDVRPGYYLHAADVAAAIARAAGADVINLSLGFETDATASDSSVDLGVLAHPDAPIDLTKQLLDQHVATRTPFSDGGCSQPCDICNALDGVESTRTAIVAAGGNFDADFCPGVHHRCTSTGFNAETRTSREGTQHISYDAPGYEQSKTTELHMAQPSGFGATSFAAPILSAACALDGVTHDLDLLLRLGLVGVPLFHRRRHIINGKEAGEPDEVRNGTLIDATHHVLDMTPDAHRHWERDDPPCMVCTLTVLPNYRILLQLYRDHGMLDDAAAWARAALQVCPLWPDLMSDLATARVDQAAAGHPDANSLLDEAATWYARSIERRAGDEAHRAFVESSTPRIDDVRARIG